MNPVIITNTALPILSGCDLLAAAEPFYHADRTADFHVMIYVLEGCIYVTEEDMDYRIRPGELFFLKSGVRHFGTREIPRGTRWYFVHFYHDCNETLPAFVPDAGPIAQYYPVKHSLALPKYLKNLSGSDIEAAIGELVTYFHSGDPMKKWDINERLFSLLTKIAHHESRSVQKQSLSDRICHYLTQHLTEPYSSAKLEQVFFLSYKHMTACFKREKGTTPQRYHTQLRMEQACKLLRSTLLPISEISHQLGYTDALYFSRCFHTCIGMSPSDYRKLPPVY